MQNMRKMSLPCDLDGGGGDVGSVWWWCKLCRKNFPTNDILGDHKKTVHPELFDFQKIEKNSSQSIHEGKEIIQQSQKNIRPSVIIAAKPVKEKRQSPRRISSATSTAAAAPRPTKSANNFLVSITTPAPPQVQVHRNQQAERAASVSPTQCKENSANFCLDDEYSAGDESDQICQDSEFCVGQNDPSIQKIQKFSSPFTLWGRQHNIQKSIDTTSKKPVLTQLRPDPKKFCGLDVKINFTKPENESPQPEEEEEGEMTIDEKFQNKMESTEILNKAPHPLSSVRCHGHRVQNSLYTSQSLHSLERLVSDVVMMRRRNDDGVEGGKLKKRKKVSGQSSPVKKKRIRKEVNIGGKKVQKNVNKIAKYKWTECTSHNLVKNDKNFENVDDDDVHNPESWTIDEKIVESLLATSLLLTPPTTPSPSSSGQKGEKDGKFSLIFDEPNLTPPVATPTANDEDGTNLVAQTKKIGEDQTARGVPYFVSDLPRYCLCNQVDYGKMVACDNRKCAIKWFHFPCVGLGTKPRGKWKCPQCAPPKKTPQIINPTTISV